MCGACPAPRRDHYFLIDLFNLFILLYFSLYTWCRMPEWEYQCQLIREAMVSIHLWYHDARLPLTSYDLNDLGKKNPAKK